MRSTTAQHRSSRRFAALIPASGLVLGLVLAAVVPAQIAHATPSVVASDQFGRTVSGSWGSAERGGAYSVIKDASTKLQASSNVGRIINLGRARAVTATLRQVQALNVDVQGVLGLPGRAPLVYQGWEIRRQANGTAYRGRLDVLKGGQVNLTVSRLDPGNVELSMARVKLPFTATTDTRIAAEFQVTGTSPVTVTARAWLVGTPQPDWMITTKDSTTRRINHIGNVGIWQYASASNPGPISTTNDSLVVTRDPDVTVTSTPTAPPVTPAPSTAPARGSVAVGAASYPVPDGSLFVSPSGDDQAAGSEGAPLRTLAAAISRVVSGQTIVLRQGVYNEQVSVPESKQNVTIENYPKEAVWLDGSVPITNWQQTGSTWTTPWSTFFPNTLDGVADNPYFVNTGSYPLAARADMVFVDGAQLKQVASASAVTAGTFAVDQNARTITIGSDPAGHEVRASNLQQAIYAKSTGTTLQGFGVRRYATPYNVRGALRLGGKGETARNIVIQDSATTGMNFENDDITLDHLTVQRSGMQGLGGNAAYNLELTNSIVSQANLEHFNEAPVSGGVKITRSRDITIRNNDFTKNYSFGLWLDESCYDATIVHNSITGNQGHGLEVEISAHALIADNVATGNGKSGIRLLDTSDSQIVNNDIGGNGVFGLQLSQDQRREADLTVPGHDPRRPKPDASFTWLTQNNLVANNRFGSGGQFQIYALDNWTGIPVDDWKLTVTGNLFTSSQATLFAWGGSDKVTLTRFSSPGALAAAKGSSWTNAQTSTSQPVEAMAVDMSSTIALPLPADIAAAVGQPTGTKHIGTF
ncbi:hypothetical protein AS850_11635 [Frondihabitans sp. 762G35]|uniref:right-handed parallel beta-helix repeat-containing protein n=1 Tax=Frondihabitans sp. 762G35 TaxID=1446794 RepID=UPI000D2059FE|nr:right-handed parallel beta-helix repeat-containing protein [Frondihabitans sp. 762G35]ARC57723.1 hypothetical protein AS850_11635 [Frondihabitans sp. 762G35]